jgi:molybdopterin/thiamine biosynthesis adenylyltransferase
MRDCCWRCEQNAMGGFCLRFGDKGSHIKKAKEKSHTTMLSLQPNSSNEDDENSIRRHQFERLDRQVHAMGTGAARRLLNTSFLVIGLDTTGCEIARNILLGGCSRLVLCDDSSVTSDDAESNFFITKDDNMPQDLQVDGSTSTRPSRGQLLSERLAPLSPDSCVEWVSECDLVTRIVSASSSSGMCVADVIVAVNVSHTSHALSSLRSRTSGQRDILLDTIDDWKKMMSMNAQIFLHRPRFLHVRCSHLAAAFYNDFCRDDNDIFHFVENAEDTSIVPLRVALPDSMIGSCTPLSSFRLLLDDTASSKATLEAIEISRALKITVSRSEVAAERDSLEVVNALHGHASSFSVVCRLVQIDRGARPERNADESRTAAAVASQHSSNAASQHFFVNVIVAGAQAEPEHLGSADFIKFDVFLERIKALGSDALQWIAFASPISIPQEMCRDSAAIVRATKCSDPWANLPQQIQVIGQDDDTEEGTPLAIRLLDAAFSPSRNSSTSLDETCVVENSRDDTIESRCRELLRHHDGGGTSASSRSRRKLIQSFAKLGHRTFLPVASMLAGIVAQEAMKAATHQHRPTYGVWSFDARWMLSSRQDGDASKDSLCTPEHASSVLECFFGADGASKLANANLLLVGAGAIGCEYLKHFAVMGIACGKRGRLDVADPDHIEISNLSRQFLFQLSDVKQSKSAVAVSKARKRAVGLKARSFQKALTPATCGSWVASSQQASSVAPQATRLGTFHADALMSLDALVGAVDNNEARNFLDSIAGRFTTPMVDSGTLGLQGHVVTVVPDVTARLTDGASPDTNSGGASIPFCTLHFFPSNVQHCIQWALNAFHELLSSPWPDVVALHKSEQLANSQEFKRACAVKYPGQNSMQEKIRFATGVLEALTFFYDWNVAPNVLSHAMPDDKNEQECTSASDQYGNLALAIVKLLYRRYDCMFVAPIEDVLRQHPPALNAQGIATDAFWKEKPQGRPPRGPDDAALQLFILAAAPLMCARLVAADEGMIAGVVSLVKGNESWSKLLVAVRQENTLPAYEDSQHTKRSSDTVRPLDATDTDAQNDALFDNLVNRISSVANKSMDARFSFRSPSLEVAAVSFDKDELSGRHVGLVTVCTNIRAWCYYIPPAGHMEVKRISGRIVPAFISTTAAVTSFAVMQLISLILVLKSEEEASSSQRRTGGLIQQRAAKLKVHNPAITHAATLRECLRDVNLSLSDTTLSFVMEPSAPRRAYSNVSARGEEQKSSNSMTTWTRWRVATSRDISVAELMCVLESEYHFLVAQIIDVVTSQIVFDRVTDGADAPRCKFPLLAFLREIWTSAASRTSVISSTSAITQQPTQVVAPPLRNGAELRICGRPVRPSSSSNDPETAQEDAPLVVYTIETQ